MGSDMVREKIEIVQDFESKLSGKKRQLCGIAQSCNQQNYTCQLSRLPVVNFDLTPTHAYETNFSRLVE